MSVRDYAVLYLGPGGKGSATAGGGNAVLSGGQHRLDAAEHLVTLDATTLDASTTAHGLLPKLSGSGLDSLRGDGTWGNPAWKQPVRVATTAAGTLASSFENGDTVDGITLATGDRILIKDQADATENGIYVVAASGAPARAADMDAAAEFPGAFVSIMAGLSNNGHVWRCTLAAAPTLGADSITFVQFAAGSGGGALYYIDSASDIATYAVLSFTPDTAAEEIDTASVAAADGEVLIDAYATASGVPGVTVIPSGTWEFHSFRKVDNATGDTRLVYRVYKYETDTTETELFGVVGGEINDTTVNVLPTEVLTVQPDFVVDATDRIVVKVFAKTTSVAARTVSFYHSGTAHYSHVESTLGAAGSGTPSLALDDLTDVDAVTGLTDQDVLTWDATGGEWIAQAAPGGGDTVGQFIAGWDGGGSAITANAKVDIVAPFTGTITAWTLLADQAGSAVVDIWLDSLANFPPTDADSITAAAPPTLSTATNATDAEDGWDTAVTAGDVLRFNLDSASTVTRLLCVVDYTRP